jgi:hypothetical protein
VVRSAAYATRRDGHLRHSARLRARRELARRLEAARRVKVADYEVVADAWRVWELQEHSIDLRDDLDTLPPDIASSFPHLYELPTEPESGPSRSFSYKSRRKKIAKDARFARKGHVPSENTKEEFVNLADIIHLAGFDAKDCRVVSTGYTAKLDDPNSPIKRPMDESKLTVQALKDMGMTLVAWDGE